MKKNFEKFYKNGLAETVDKPSETTLHLFNHWFTGNESLGLAMNMLGLPCTQTNLGLFEIHNGELVVNIDNENETLYSNTIFDFKLDENGNPSTVVDFLKLFNLNALGNTFKILSFQTKLLGSGDKTVAMAREFLAGISEDTSYKTAAESVEFISKNVWPYALAIGYINDFYSSYLERQHKNSFTTLLKNINPHLVKEDWVFKANEAIANLGQNKEDVEKFLNEYGNMADDPYEITCPRWHEIIDQLSTRNSGESQTFEKSHSSKLSHEENTLKDLLVIRSQAKKKVLIHLNKLRILYGLNNIASYSYRQNTHAKTPTNGQNIGKGKAVSSGEAQGLVEFVTSPEQEIAAGSIGIFPNAGPLLSHKYKQCVGIIFLSGGIMSHGSILARELNIPAIIDENANNLKKATQIHMNGDTGIWETN